MLTHASVACFSDRAVYMVLRLKMVHIAGTGEKEFNLQEEFSGLGKLASPKFDANIRLSVKMYTISKDLGSKLIISRTQTTRFIYQTDSFILKDIHIDYDQKKDSAVSP